MGNEASARSTSRAMKSDRSIYGMRSASKSPLKPQITTIDSLSTSFNKNNVHSYNMHKFWNSLDSGRHPQHSSPYNTPPRQQFQEARRTSPKQSSDGERYSENIRNNQDFVIKVDVNALKAMKTVTDLSAIKLPTDTKSGRWKRLKKLCKDENTCMRISLASSNVVLLILGVVGLVTAGIVDPKPMHQLHTTGGQLSCFSVFTIIASLICLYGLRYQSFSLLITYGCMILSALFLRSISFLTAVLFFEAGTSALFLIITAIFEIILAILAFAVAVNYRNSKQTQSSKPNIPVS